MIKNLIGRPSTGTVSWASVHIAAGAARYRPPARLIPGTAGTGFQQLMYVDEVKEICQGRVMVYGLCLFLI